MKKIKYRWKLILLDLLILLAVDYLLLRAYPGPPVLTWGQIAEQTAVTVFCMLTARIFSGIYHQIWRYGGIQCYLRLMVADVCAFVANYILENLLLGSDLPLFRLMTIACLNFMGALTMRMLYRYAYKFHNSITLWGRFWGFLLWVFTGNRGQIIAQDEPEKTKIAIIGAGRVGVSLAEELLSSHNGDYVPGCFVDANAEKADRNIHGIPVYLEGEEIFERLKDKGIREVVFAIPDLPDDQKKKLYESYLQAGFKIKAYDYPTMHTAGGKRYMRDFDIEELLLREPVEMGSEKVSAYYKDKVVLITGGGGSIGSELCRQLAKMQPRQIVILDIYENGAYDVQQELRIAYGEKLNLQVEIASITNMRAMKRVFEAYKPQIVINAAAHKHVPLMERNCIEAVENNVFGTVNLVQLCEEYGAERFMMVSTDKAVNPTNVMGATKRLCEMIVQSASCYGKVKYSATRFGNVLGSAGSVIPLFKKQIATGGPVTLTDKRVIRYFMTIPEASQLVLESGAMAQNGELFVLDMGQPVRILDLAQNMIRLSGVKGVEIVETGLRPGEKLYEELLVKTEELSKTENSLIFIERDTPCTREEIEKKLQMLKTACMTENDNVVRTALHETVPTFQKPEEVNREAVLV